MADTAIKKLTSMEPYSVTEPSPYEAALKEVGYKKPETTQQEKFLKDKAEADIRVAGEKKRLGKESLERTEEIYGRPELQQQKIDAFTPSQESGSDLAKLFALTTAIAFVGGGRGRYSGMTAMNNLASAMEGYRKGRKDLFAQEMKEYDKNMKAALENNRIIQGHLEKYLALAAKKDANAATELEMIKALTGRQGALAEIEKLTENDKAKVAETLARSRADWKKHVDDMLAKKTELNIRRSAYKPIGVDEKGNIVEENSLGERRTIEGVKPLKGAGTGSAGGAVQFRYNSAMANAGNQLAMEISNAASLPLSATPPVAAEVLTNPSKSLTDAARAYFAQKVTPEEQRAMQQIFAGMSRAITTIEASGRPSGATEAAIKEFSKTLPKGSDGKINNYLFLAQAKQVMEILVDDLNASGGTKEQIALAEKAKAKVDAEISWTVKDVNRILSAGKRTLVDEGVRRSLQASENLKQLNKDLKEKSVQSVGQEQSVTPSQAPSAPTKYDSADAVKQAYQSGQITKEQAKEILVKDFGMQ